MASVSLKERMKQLQELKTSVQAKGQAVAEREKELGEIATGETKLQLETTSDDQTSGGETQTTAGETAASPALPPALVTEEAEGPPKSEPPPSTLPQVDETPAGEVDEVPAEAVEKTEQEEEYEGKFLDSV
jgi:hypothetical protein